MAGWVGQKGFGGDHILFPLSISCQKFGYTYLLLLQYVADVCDVGNVVAHVLLCNAKRQREQVGCSSDSKISPKLPTVF